MDHEQRARELLTEADYELDCGNVAEARRFIEQARDILLAGWRDRNRPAEVKND